MTAPELVRARAVLLDAVEALGDQLPALVLIGAQAVYQHVSHTDLALPVMTTDADIALHVSRLAATDVAGDLSAAGFDAPGQPGHWTTDDDVAVDVMVVPHESGRTSPSARSARIPGQDKRTARIAPGLEPCLVDNAVQVLRAFDPDDARTVAMAVAGPAALIVAKVHKLAERRNDPDPDRLIPKDALDLFRLLQGVPLQALLDGFASHGAEPAAAAASHSARQMLAEHGSTTDGWLPQLVAQQLFDDQVAAASFAALTVELLEALTRQQG